MYMRPTPSRAWARYSVLQEVAQPLQRGIDRRRRSTGGYSSVSRARSAAPMAFGKVLDRPPIRRVLGLELELVVELLDHVADGELGVDDALRFALAPLRDRLVDIASRNRGCASGCSHSRRRSRTARRPARSRSSDIRCAARRNGSSAALRSAAAGRAEARAAYPWSGTRTRRRRAGRSALSSARGIARSAARSCSAAAFSPGNGRRCKRSPSRSA